AITGLARDLEIALRVDDQREPGPHERLVVDEHHPDGVVPRRGGRVLRRRGCVPRAEGVRIGHRVRSSVARASAAGGAEDCSVVGGAGSAAERGAADGNRAVTVKPCSPPRRAPASSDPPYSAARSRIPMIPLPAPSVPEAPEPSVPEAPEPRDARSPACRAVPPSRRTGSAWGPA